MGATPIRSRGFRGHELLPNVLVGEARHRRPSVQSSSITLRENAVRGFSIVVALKVVSTLAARASALVLPLLLGPDDFGIFAITLVFVNVLLIVADFGLGSELVRRGSEPAGTLKTAFTLRCLFALLTLAAAPFIGFAAGALYGDDRLVVLIPLTCLNVLLAVFTFPSRVVASQRLQYGRAAGPDQLSKIAASLLVVGFALSGFGYWSFPLSAIAASLVAIALFQIAIPWRPSLHFERQTARRLVGPGKFIMLTFLVTLVAHSVDTAYLGLFAGTMITGYYVVAYSWSVQITSNVSSVVSGVTYPIFAKIWDAAGKIRSGLREVIRFYGYLATFTSAGALLLAEAFVISLLGVAWSPVVLPMRILSAAGFLMGLATVIFDALIAVGRSGLVFRAAVAEAILVAAIMPPVVIFGGLFGASLIVTLGAAMSLALGLRALRGALSLPSLPILRSLWVPLAAALLTAPVVIALDMFLENGLVQFAFLLLAYCVTFLGFLTLLTRGSILHETLDYARGALRGRILESR